MADTIDEHALRAAVERIAARVPEWGDELNRLDAATGDGDLGITMGKGAAALRAHLAAPPAAGSDVGSLLIALGMAFNRAAPSTMGTLLATALMRAGKEARGLAALDGAALARVLRAADAGVQERGKASLGDKTMVDALHPAAEAFAAAIEQGASLEAAGQALLQAARQGRDAVIPLRSKMGRAAWVGERTENQPDAGTVLLVRVIEATLDTPGSTSQPA
jgi:phosphoenolpyruvate---glycerone phosphotransferase subunit DhaL